jgi:hypothetical protein
MTNDEDFGRELRGLAGRVEPRVAVDTTGVIARARRRRAATWTGAGAAFAVGATAVALVGASLPWPGGAQAAAGARSVTYDPTGTANPPSATQAATPGPTAAPGEPVAGYPDAPYWFVAMQTWQPSGEVHTEEWYEGHTKPGLLIEDKDVANATGIGPSSWGRFDINGVDTLLRWDALYRLPTDPAALGAILADGIDRSRGNGDDADRETSMISDMLYGSPASPALRQALWTVAAGLPRTTVTPGVADSSGRQGTQLTHTELSGSSTSWVYDAVDGAVLERADAVEGMVKYRWTYLDQGPAYDIPKEPSLASSGCASWATC